MTCTFLVLQHVDWEVPGRLLLDSARQLNINLEVITVYSHPIPDPAGFDALVLLGGPPNVDEEDRYPFLREEKRFIKAWLAMDRPCLGFCLGHQLLAHVLDAEVGANFMASVGFVQGHLTRAGRKHRIFKDMDPAPLLFKWHGQAIRTPLPRDLVLLATSSQCVVEAFSVAGRPHIVGLQCDNHAAHPDDVRSWLHHDREWLVTLPHGEEIARDLTDQAERSLLEMETMFARLLENFHAMVLASGKYQKEF